MNIIGGLINGGLALGANALGIGKNDTRARTFAESQGAPGGYDPNAFQYGGAPGGANAAAQQYGGLAAGAQQHQAAQAATVNAPQQVGVDYSGGRGYQQAGNQSVGGMGDMAGLMAARANGQMPSIAQMQADRQMQQATAAQASAGASARGAGGLALAQQNAANNTATMQSAISNQAQINGAQEQQQNVQNAYNAYGGIANTNYGQQAQQAQQAQYGANMAMLQGQFNANLGAQQNQFNANLQAGNQQANNQYALGLYGLQNNVQQGQLNAGIQQQGMLGGNFQNATNQNIGISQSNANREYQYYQQGIGGAQGAADASTQSGLAGSGGGGGGGGGGSPPPMEQFRANGGPVSAGQPYVVGERGPELVVPQKNGYVLPAEHPASRMATMSDDRAKFGMSPLSMFGLGGGGPSSGPGVAGISGPAYSMTGNGGVDVKDTARLQGLASTGYGSDPSGGMMGGGLLSDDRAKEAAYEEGAAAAARQITGDDSAVAPWDEGAPSIADEARSRGEYAPPGPHPLPLPPPPMAGSARSSMGFMRGGGDPVTDQFADGLAPIRFQYKPGMGPGGPQTGVRAQAAASQPLTSSMVQQRPDGLLAIDPQMGLGTALAGVGHLAKKQREQDSRLEGLLAMSASKEGYR